MLIVRGFPVKVGFLVRLRFGILLARPELDFNLPKRFCFFNKSVEKLVEKEFQFDLTFAI